MMYAGRKLTNPDKVYELTRHLIEDSDRENLMVVCLNTKNEPTAIEIVSVGTINSSPVHPREVFKVAVLSNAARVILVHNHPSGDPTPSSEDIGVTKRLVEAGKILGVEVVDHIVIGEGCYKSMKVLNIV